MMNEKEYEKHYRQIRRRRRKHAIKAMLNPNSVNSCRLDYGTLTAVFVWLKTFICLILNRIKPLRYGVETCVVVSYDMYFDVDHYEWTSIFVSPNWFKNWYVSIEDDGE